MMVTAGAVSVFVGFQKVPIPELERVEQNKQKKTKKHNKESSQQRTLTEGGLEFRAAN